MLNKTILVTGASGFIGKALVKKLCQTGYNVRAVVRSNDAVQSLIELKKHLNPDSLTLYNLGEFTEKTDWSPVLNTVEAIIHCAARAHVLRETSSDPLTSFRQINCQATEQLLNDAVTQKVRRFIFISSIGVLGNSSGSLPFTEDTIPNPTVPYAQSKLEAEQMVSRYSSRIETVIIRPPLVYGPGVKGNFKKLLDLVNKGIPLPLGNIRNKRHFVGIDNLVDLIIHCVNAPQAANQTFLVSDKESISTTELIQLISKLMAKKTTMLPVPTRLLQWFFYCIGRSNLTEQLLNSLEVVPNNTKDLLDWEPPFSMLDQMRQTVDHHKLE